MSAAAAIEIDGLRKAYGDFEAVCGLSLTVRRGEIFAFLGPNGAGKTTTVEMAYQLVPAPAEEALGRRISAL